MCRILDQSYEDPYSRKLRLCVSMFAYVHSRGSAPRWMAAFSAGSPNESQPIGFRTL